MTTQQGETQGAAGQSTDVLRVEHIAKSYGAVTALTDVNLRLAKGEVLGLLGDNGAGKSTLIKILCGFQPPTAGRILLGGQEVTLQVRRPRQVARHRLRLPGPGPGQPAERLPQHVPEPGEGALAAAVQPDDEAAGPPVPGRDGRRHPVRGGRRRPAVRRPAAGDRGGARRLLRREDPAARRAARRHGRQGGGDHPRPGARAQGARATSRSSSSRTTTARPWRSATGSTCCSTARSPSTSRPRRPRSPS